MAEVVEDEVEREQRLLDAQRKAGQLFEQIDTLQISSTWVTDVGAGAMTRVAAAEARSVRNGCARAWWTTRSN
jgi:hypothetical protein